MQIVINKVENGYICTLDGKMYVFVQLTHVAAFLVHRFDDCIITGLLDELTCPSKTYPSQEYESFTSDSK
jgi:hypothetical protein